MKDSQDPAALPINDKVPAREGTPTDPATHVQTTPSPFASTNPTSDDNQARRDATTGYLPQHSAQTSKSGFPIAKAGHIDRSAG